MILQKLERNHRPLICWRIVPLCQRLNECIFMTCDKMMERGLQVMSLLLFFFPLAPKNPNSGCRASARRRRRRASCPHTNPSIYSRSLLALLALAVLLGKKRSGGWVGGGVNVQLCGCTRRNREGRREKERKKAPLSSSPLLSPHCLRSFAKRQQMTGIWREGGGGGGVR